MAFPLQPNLTPSLMRGLDMSGLASMMAANQPGAGQSAGQTEIPIAASASMSAPVQMPPRVSPDPRMAQAPAGSDPASTGSSSFGLRDMAPLLAMGLPLLKGNSAMAAGFQQEWARRQEQRRQQRRQDEADTLARQDITERRQDRAALREGQLRDDQLRFLEHVQRNLTEAQTPDDYTARLAAAKLMASRMPGLQIPDAEIDRLVTKHERRWMANRMAALIKRLDAMQEKFPEAYWDGASMLQDADGTMITIRDARQLTGHGMRRDATTGALVPMEPNIPTYGEVFEELAGTPLGNARVPMKDGLPDLTAAALTARRRRVGLSSAGEQRAREREIRERRQALRDRLTHALRAPGSVDLGQLRKQFVRSGLDWDVVKGQVEREIRTEDLDLQFKERRARGSAIDQILGDTLEDEGAASRIQAPPRPRSSAAGIEDEMTITREDVQVIADAEGWTYAEAKRAAELDGYTIIER